MKTIALTAALICGIFLLPHVYAQVEVKQTQTSTVNGQMTSVKQTGDGNTSNTKMSIESGGSADLTLKPGELKIHYCSEFDNNRCHNYTLWANGTITKGGEKK